jgi:hypothetical protein
LLAVPVLEEYLGTTFFWYAKKNSGTYDLLFVSKTFFEALGIPMGWWPLLDLHDAQPHCQTHMVGKSVRICSWLPPSPNATSHCQYQHKISDAAAEAKPLVDNVEALYP